MFSILSSQQMPIIATYNPMGGIKITASAVGEEPGTMFNTHIVERKDPRFVYAIARAVTADVPNKNRDMFPLEEIKKAYTTFIGRNIFLDHNTKSVRNAVGKIIAAELREDENGQVYVACLFKIDRELHPDIAHKIENGIIDSVSMGANVAKTVCRICSHEASRESDFCQHQKNPMLYPDYYAINHGVEFTELSLVSVPADPSAKMHKVFNLNQGMNKVAVGADEFSNQGDTQKPAEETPAPEQAAEPVQPTTHEPAQDTTVIQTKEELPEGSFYQIDCASNETADLIYNILYPYLNKGIEDINVSGRGLKVHFSADVADPEAFVAEAGKMFGLLVTKGLADQKTASLFNHYLQKTAAIPSYLKGTEVGEFTAKDGDNKEHGFVITISTQSKKPVVTIAIKSKDTKFNIGNAASAIVPVLTNIAKEYGAVKELDAKQVNSAADIRFTATFDNAKDADSFANNIAVKKDSFTEDIASVISRMDMVAKGKTLSLHSESSDGKEVATKKTSTEIIDDLNAIAERTIGNKEKVDAISQYLLDAGITEEGTVRGYLSMVFGGSLPPETHNPIVDKVVSGKEPEGMENTRSGSPRNLSGYTKLDDVSNDNFEVYTKVSNNKADVVIMPGKGDDFDKLQYENLNLRDLLTKAFGDKVDTVKPASDNKEGKRYTVTFKEETKTPDTESMNETVSKSVAPVLTKQKEDQDGVPTGDAATNTKLTINKFLDVIQATMGEDKSSAVTGSDVLSALEALKVTPDEAYALLTKPENQNVPEPKLRSQILTELTKLREQDSKKESTEEPTAPEEKNEQKDAEPIKEEPVEPKQKVKQEDKVPAESPTVKDVRLEQGEAEKAQEPTQKESKEPVEEAPTDDPEEVAEEVVEQAAEAGEREAEQKLDGRTLTLSIGSFQIYDIAIGGLNWDDEKKKIEEAIKNHKVTQATINKIKNHANSFKQFLNADSKFGNLTLHFKAKPAGKSETGEELVGEVTKKKEREYSWVGEVVANGNTSNADGNATTAAEAMTNAIVVPKAAWERSYGTENAAPVESPAQGTDNKPNQEPTK